VGSRYPDEVTPDEQQQVLDIEVERDLEVRITFGDQVKAIFPVLALRRGCPCAGCRGHRDAGREAYLGAEITVTAAELHGNWGVSLVWSDGHSTGIYAWSYLRSWWDAGVESIP